VATLLNNLEGGTSGTAVSAANSGGTSGNAFDAVNIVTGGTLAYSSAHAAHGTLSMVAATGTTTTSGSYAQWGTSLGTVTTHYGRAYLYLSAAPASTDAVIEYLSAGTFRAGIQVTTGRQIQVQDAAFGFIHTFTAVIPTAQWVRVEWQIVFSATAGQAVISYYASMDSATATETYTSPASQNFGASANQLQFGWNNGHASQPSVYFDDLGGSTTGLLGPATTTWTLAGATTVTSSTAGALAWTAVLAGTATDSSVTAGTLAWLAPITGTAASASITAGDVYRSGGRSSPLLTSAQAVTTGPASSTLAVPAQAGVQAGDLILIWAATGG
jgi:hypothetical protein